MPVSSRLSRSETIVTRNGSPMTLRRTPRDIYDVDAPSNVYPALFAGEAELRASRWWWSARWRVSVQVGARIGDNDWRQASYSNGCGAELKARCIFAPVTRYDSESKRQANPTNICRSLIGIRHERSASTRVDWHILRGSAGERRDRASRGSQKFRRWTNMQAIAMRKWSRKSSPGYCRAR